MIGPMARDVDTLALAIKAVCVPKMWELDPSVPPLPFNEEVESHYLSINDISDSITVDIGGTFIKHV